MALTQLDSRQVKYTPPGTDAVTTTVQEKLRETVSVFDFMTAAEIADVKSYAATIDVTAAVQAAIEASVVLKKKLHMPGGAYYVTDSLLFQRSSGEYRGDVVSVYGDGANSPFMPYSSGMGTTIITDVDVPIVINNESIANGSGRTYITGIRFEQTNTNATSYVLDFDILAAGCIDYLAIVQNGKGGGIRVSKSFVTNYENIVIINGDSTNQTPGLVRTGTGFDIQPQTSGGLITLRKITSRGFATGYKVCDPVVSTVSMLLEQVECSVVTDGISIGAGGLKTVLDTCYFEGIQGKCIIDKGRATTIQNCHMFSSAFTVGIDSTYLTEGNTYTGNNIYLGETNQIGIDLYTQGDSPGYSKTVRDNFIYFINSGGVVAGVNGIRLTGANPAANIVDNTFKPRRDWVGGAGTIKINNASTGVLTGNIPITDSLNEYPKISSAIISLAHRTSPLTEANVSGSVLSIPAGSSFVIAATVATDVTAISTGTVKDARILLFRLNNDKLTFKDNTYLLMAGDFSGPGIIMFQSEVIGSSLYAYEISRTLF